MKSYARLLRVDAGAIEQMLRLPKGFRIDALEGAMLDGHPILTIRLACPRSKRFAVAEGEAIPYIGGTVTARYDKRGHVLSIKWPELE